MAVNERDFEFGPDDAKIAALYRDAARDEPPAALDAAVSRNARSAVAPRSAEPRASWWMPWRVPFAFAAVAVLSVSVVLVADREGGAPMKLEQREAAPAAAPAREPAPMTSPKAADTAPAGPEPTTVPGQAPAGTRAKTVTAPPAPPETDAAGPAENRIAASGQAGEAGRAKAEPEARRDERESADRLQALAKRRAEDSAKVIRDEPAPQPPLAATAPPPPAAAREAAPAAGAAAPAMRPYAMQDAKPLASQRRAAAADAMTPAVAALVAELDKRPPAEWLARIAALRREGRAADAEGLLAEFRRRFPEEPVPPADR
ncbi:MAG TPA: hypothetical protein VHP37_12760 [Burkholderiales bacterium]|nr:hypothetical protein [Burkholderiales bacterium]